MVLEDSSNSNEADFNESPPPSDDDPYSRSSPQVGVNNYIIDYLKLPKPMPIYGTLAGWNADVFEKLLGSRLETHASFLKRLPNQEEVDAIAYYTAKQISIVSYATPAGVLAGSWRAYKTMSTFRFPFYQPNLDTFKPYDFFTSRISILKGNNAVMAWHLLRFALYGGVGQFVSKILFASYSASVIAVGELGDPRLKAVKDEMMSQSRKRAQNRGTLPGPKMPGTAGSPSSGGMVGNAPPRDDASPTGGMFSEENGTGYSSGFGENASGSNDDPRTQEQPRQWPQQSRPSPPPTQREENEERPFDPFGDSSSGSPDNANNPTSPSQLQRQQGSAWDRIRRGAGKDSLGRQAETGQSRQSGGWAGVREQAQSPTASDDAAFARENEDRSLGREQAQKEFDARVEKERTGGDFSGGGGDQKRW